MVEIYTIISRTFDFFFIPFQHLGPRLGLITFSILTGVVMLGVYRFTSNQDALKKTNDQIKRYFLEVRLYKDDFRTTFKALKKILKFNLTYMKLSLVPAIVLIVPIVIIMIQLNLRFGYKPIKVDEIFIVTLKFSDKVSLKNVDVSIEAPEGIIVETPALRLLDEREVSWRVKVSQTGSYELVILISGKRFTKEIYVGNGVRKLSPFRLRRNLHVALLYPGEPYLPEDSMIKSIRVDYPKRTFNLWEWDTNWIVIFFGLSLVSALVFKRLFKVA